MWSYLFISCRRNFVRLPAHGAGMKQRTRISFSSPPSSRFRSQIGSFPEVFVTLPSFPCPRNRHEANRRSRERGEDRWWTRAEVSVRQGRARNKDRGERWRVPLHPSATAGTAAASSPVCDGRERTEFHQDFRLVWCLNHERY